MVPQTQSKADDAPAPTPMMRQFLRTKAEHPEEILLYRVGDFYETFGEDAHTISRILNIVLTKKHFGNGRTMPMAGIPYHALDNYLGRLIKAGRRVAICEQVEDPKQAKGPVRREVVRVVTPGTVMEEALLEDKANNFLVAIARHRGDWGLARCDVSTGALGATQLGGHDPRAAMLDELARLGPAELIATAEDLELIAGDLDSTASGVVKTRIDAGLAKLEPARAALLEQFQVQTLEGFGAEDAPAAICAAGALAAYLRETQHRIPGHLNRLEIYASADWLVLDAVTQRSLELVRNLHDGGPSGTLLAVLDRTRTPMGGRLLRQWLLQPLQDLAEIHARQEAIASLIEKAPLRDQVGDGLKGIRDLERILSRVHHRSAHARDLLAMARSLRETPSIKAALEAEGRGALARIAEEIDPLLPLARKLEGALAPDPPVTLREGGLIRDGFDDRLDELREITRGGKTWIGEFKKTESERTGIPKLKIGYNRVFGYYIEVGKAQAPNVPDDYERRQTLANAERFITPALKEKEAMILGAQEKIHEREYELFEKLRQGVEDQTRPIQRLAARLAAVDALLSLADAALEGGFARPEVDASDLIEIHGGRHPVVEAMLTDRPFVPNDLELDTRQSQIWIITGPNMAGKSTFIRQTAIITLMAHVGSFVPARSARIGLIDRIFTRVGATDYLTRGQSTFLVEMTETANILHNATNKSLVILDEIGRGTSTYDGLSIAWAVVEYLHSKRGRRAKTLFATHYHELAGLEGKLRRVKNHKVAVQEEGDAIRFLYHIQPGGSEHSFGIHAARLAGLPEEAIDRAREILFELECQRHVGDEPPAADPDQLPAIRREIAPSESIQPDLFEALENPIVTALRKLDVVQITPMQALQILDELARASRDQP